MTSNALVAAPAEAATNRWAGVWIVEDIQLIGQGIKDGSWIDGGLGVVGASLDGLALVSDPLGSLLQYGVAWIIEHVRPLTEALDWLAGDPAQIAAHAQTWRNVAASLRDEADSLIRASRLDVSEWGGSAGPAYRSWADEQQQAINGLGEAADTMALITEGAGMLIAAVRLMVRDAIATCVSRLIVYAAEEAATLGFATPLVVEQVTTTVAAWAAKIAGWLRGLLSSLRRLIPEALRLSGLIEKLKKLLSRLMNSATSSSQRGPGGRSDLLEELKRAGIRHKPDDILEIGWDGAGRIIFLETGNARAGLAHIIGRHAQDFASIGVPEDKIGRMVFAAVTNGEVVGLQRSRPIYEVLFDGRLHKVAVSVGDNGFIVGANPVGR